MNGSSYTQEKKKDGSIALVPVAEEDIEGFDITKGTKGSVDTHEMVKVIRKFINDYAEKGIYGLFGEGEKLSLEKWR